MNVKIQLENNYLEKLVHRLSTNPVFGNVVSSAQILVAKIWNFANKHVDVRAWIYRSRGIDR
jgi:hypothetical protein